MVFVYLSLVVVASKPHFLKISYRLISSLSSRF